MKKTFVLPGEIESFPSKIMLMNSTLDRVMYNLRLLTVYLEGIEVMWMVWKWIVCLARQCGSAVTVSKKALSAHCKNLFFQLVY
jgi:hypothetical protein